MPGAVTAEEQRESQQRGARRIAWQSHRREQPVRGQRRTEASRRALLSPEWEADRAWIQSGNRVMNPFWHQLRSIAMTGFYPYRGSTRAGVFGYKTCLSNQYGNRQGFRGLR